MKRIILYFIIVLVAVAIAPQLVGDKGYILIAIGDISIESNVVAAVILLVFTFLFLLIGLKVFGGGIRITTNAWRSVITTSKRKAERHFKQGVSAYLLEDYAQAEQLLVKSAEKSPMPSMAFSIAASAAQKQDEAANSEYYLECLAQQLDSNPSLEQVLVIINQQVSLKNYTKARTWLDDYHKHLGHDTRLLALEIEVSLNEQRFEHVLEYLPKAYKEKTYSATRIYEWDHQAYLGHFSQLISQGGKTALVNFWQKLAKKLKQKEAIVLAYCHVLANNHLVQELDDLLLPALKYDVDERFVKQLRNLALTQCVSLIKEAQKHLHKDPHNSKWLSCLGFLAFADKQFEMSAKVYAALIQQPNSYDNQDIILYAKALSANHEHEKSNQILLQHVKLDK